MNKTELIQAITEEKKKRGTLIAAHTYQPPEIIGIADFTGDSFALSVAAAKTEAPRVILCGVRFMAETVKILSPEKEVILAAPGAGCPMAEQISPDRVARFKQENPGIPVVAYINTTAELKARCDVCVTSSTAVKIVSALPAKEILFIPDKNLGAWVQNKVPEKNIILWDGYCPVHNAVTAADILAAKAAHPAAKIALHPECPPDALDLADMIGSTKEIIDYCLKQTGSVVIGTERGVADMLTLKYPERDFFYLCPEKLVCPDMKLTALTDVYRCLLGEGGEIIELDEEIRLAAKKCVDKMIELGG